MKRCVKHAVLRRQWLAAACVPLCAFSAVVACSAKAGTSGLVVAPMTSASVAATTVDASVDAGMFTVRALPEEPRQPPNSANCTRDVTCEDPEPTALSWPFPSPFERCKPVLEKGEKKFSVAETKTHRDQDGTDTCCYVQFEGCGRHYNYNSGRGYDGPIPGRPLVDELGVMHVAEAIAGDAWMSPVERCAHDDDRAKRWVRAGLLEHASVASFARFGLSLMALGAPSELVFGAHRAALDEIEHAKLSFALAVRFGHQAVAPGPLDVMDAPSCSLRDLVRETLALGCVNEAIAAAIAAEAAAVTSDDAERHALELIARDEASHAALAYRTIAWARSLDDALVQSEIEAALGLLDSLTSLGEDVVLDAETSTAVAASVLTHAIKPCLLALRS
jgi:hypothetical protein